MTNEEISSSRLKINGSYVPTVILVLGALTAGSAIWSVLSGDTVIGLTMVLVAAVCVLTTMYIEVKRA